MQGARLIPVSGIASEKEAEQRAASALLAVLTIVRDLSVELLSPLGASKAHRATVEAFTEPVYTLGNKRIRPDGLVRVSFGKSEWTCFVEVKTGEAKLETEQLNDYWDLARQEKIDHILTISNEIPPTPNVHPAAGLKVRSNSRVKISHLSWTAILTTAVRLKQHRGVEDPEQAWILGELIRYLEHPASGALAFTDMGPNWAAIRDAARSNNLNRRDPATEDTARRWDQLIRFAGLKLSSQIGADVTQVLSKPHREDPKARLNHLVNELAAASRLDAALRIPNTVADLELVADLHGQQIMAYVDVPAPEDRGARGRVSWLVAQLKDAHGGLTVEAYAKNARTGTAASLANLREDRDALFGEDKRSPAKFRIVQRSPMGATRKAGGKNPGFIDSVLGAIDTFYGTVVQAITPWTPPTPKIKRPSQIETTVSAGRPPMQDDDGPAPVESAPPTPPTEIDRSDESEHSVPLRTLSPRNSTAGDQPGDGQPLS